MFSRHLLLTILSSWVLASSGCSSEPSGPPVYPIAPGDDAQARLQQALLEAPPGACIELARGDYLFSAPVEIDRPGLTLRGQGSEVTTLRFRADAPADASLVLRGAATSVERLTLADPPAAGLRAVDAAHVQLRNVQVVWRSDAPRTAESNGLHLERCSDALVEACTVRGAGGAGIHVAQSQRVIVRHNATSDNLAGIRVENSQQVDVHDNDVRANAGGILLLCLPEGELQAGRGCRVFNNALAENNRANDAPAGTLAALLPPGCGLIVLAYDEVEVFGNRFAQHDTGHAGVLSYLITELPCDDPQYDPYPEAISLHHNEFAGRCNSPRGELGQLLTLLLKSYVPEIVYDGVEDEAKQVAGRLPESLRLSIYENGAAEFVNLDYRHLDLKRLVFGRPARLSRDLAPYDVRRPPLPAVVFSPRP